MANEHTWARWGPYGLMAPLPIAMVFFAVMAYGEWLHKMVSLYQTDVNEFFNRIFIGIGRTVTGLVVVALLIGFLWVGSDVPHQWILWEAVKYSFGHMLRVRSWILLSVSAIQLALIAT